VYGVPLNHESKTEDFYFSFFFQSVSRANTANMNAPPMVVPQPASGYDNLSCLTTNPHISRPIDDADKTECT
jgi:hypothetical protein